MNMITQKRKTFPISPRLCLTNISDYKIDSIINEISANY